jgi:hypothetical protein
VEILHGLFTLTGGAVIVAVVIVGIVIWRYRKLD